VTWLLLLSLSAVIIWAGRYLARYGDMLAEKTGMGRTWIGAVLVAATTSLPELFAGVGAAGVFRLPEIAVGDVLGSCMFNLLILSMMDAIGGKAPISARMSRGHALAIGFGCVLSGVAGISLTAGTRLWAVGWVGVSTPVLIAVYLLAMRVTFRYEQRRLEAQAEQVAAALHYAEVPLRAVWLRYAVSAAVVVSAAVFLPRTGEAIARETGLEQSFVGTLFIGVATSLPEVVVSITAMRLGAVDLAVGNVLGSNLFNMFILGLDDVLYRPGALLAAVSAQHLVAVLAVLTMNGILLAGLTFQALKKRLVVGWDALGIAAVYAVTMLMYVGLD
jgi:cation:H+ antiporter